MPRQEILDGISFPPVISPSPHVNPQDGIQRFRLIVERYFGTSPLSTEIKDHQLFKFRQCKCPCFCASRSQEKRSLINLSQSSFHSDDNDCASIIKNQKVSSDLISGILAILSSNNYDDPLNSVSGTDSLGLLSESKSIGSSTRVQGDTIQIISDEESLSADGESKQFLHELETSNTVSLPADPSSVERVDFVLDGVAFEPSVERQQGSPKNDRKERPMNFLTFGMDEESDDDDANLNVLFDSNESSSEYSIDDQSDSETEDNESTSLDELLPLPTQVNVLRLPDSLDTSEQSAAELQEVCTKLDANMFRNDVDCFHRHFPSREPDNEYDDGSDSESSLQILPNEDAKRKLGSNSDSDDVDPGSAGIDKKVPFKKQRISSPDNRRRSTVASVISSDFESSDESCPADIFPEDEGDERSSEGDSSDEESEVETNNENRIKSEVLKKDEVELINVIPDSGDTSAKKISTEEDQNVVKKRVRDPPPTEKELKLPTRVAIANERKRVEKISTQESNYEKIISEIVYQKKRPRLILDIDIKTKKVRVEVAGALARELKPHQKDGIKFMYNNTIGNVDQLDEPGTGCILAHCMGLGKTFQVVTYVHTLLANPITSEYIKTILITVPVNVLKNWIEEFDKWITDKGLDTFLVHEIVNDVTPQQRLERLDLWQEQGGVLIIGHNLLANLLGYSFSTRKKNIDSEMIKKFDQFLARPGPDILVVDEGHYMKTETSRLRRAVSRMSTKRKIVLTGTPLQNKFSEFFRMVEIIKPRLLGSIDEFRSRFSSPIWSGQGRDHDKFDVAIMEQQTTILHKLLEGSIQRFNFEILKAYLPPKIEYVITIKPTKKITEIYNFYLDHVERWQQLFKDFSFCLACCNHPYAAAIYEDKRVDTEDLGGVERKYKTFSVEGVEKSNGLEIPLLTKNWFKRFIELEDRQNIELSGKFALLFKILRKCIAVDEKLVVVSQSKETLTLIAECLKSIKKVEIRGVNVDMEWKFKKNYFRIDGDTKASDRFTQVKRFNSPGNTSCHLFLISTRAGGVGIDLIGANRCIIFDHSWNPSNDCQAIFRVFRLGQTKPVYIYRFVTKDTMEAEIFNRQIEKIGIAMQVVDKVAVQPRLLKFSEKDLYLYYRHRPKKDYVISLLDVPQDRLLADILHEGNEEVLELNILDSFLQDKLVKNRTEEERKAAWIEYKKERKEREKATKEDEKEQLEEKKKADEFEERKRREDKLKAEEKRKEAERQQIEEERRKDEEKKAHQRQEEKKRAEEKRLAEEKRKAKELKKLENEKRKQREEDEKRRAEELRLEEEKRRAEKKRREEEEAKRIAEEKKRAEEKRLEEEKRQAEKERRIAEEKKKEERKRAEEKRLTEEKKKVEEAKKLEEENRRQREKEKQRAEEKRREEDEKKKRAEEKRKEEERKRAEEKQRKDEKKKADQKRKEDEKKIAETRKSDSTIAVQKKTTKKQKETQKNQITSKESSTNSVRASEPATRKDVQPVLGSVNRMSVERPLQKALKLKASSASRKDSSSQDTSNAQPTETPLKPGLKNSNTMSNKSVGSLVKTEFISDSLPVQSETGTMPFHPELPKIESTTTILMKPDDNHLTPTLSDQPITPVSRTSTPDPLLAQTKSVVRSASLSSPFITNPSSKSQAVERSSSSKRKNRSSSSNVPKICKSASTATPKTGTQVKRKRVGLDKITDSSTSQVTSQDQKRDLNSSSNKPIPSSVLKIVNPPKNIEDQKSLTPIKKETPSRARSRSKSRSASKRKPTK